MTLARAGSAVLLLLVCVAGLSACGQVATVHGADAAQAPVITTQPQDQVVNSGEQASFAVVAQGSGPLTYQWRRNGARIEGAAAPTYTTPATNSDDGAVFSVLVGNTAGMVESESATLTVNPATVAPTITAQPQDQTITSGQTASFSVQVSGTSPFSFQWQRDGIAITGATSATYTTSAQTTADSAASFTVVVSNAGGSVTSRSAILTVNGGGGGAVAPTITTQPADQSVKSGQTATFSVAASGTAPLTYQWARNGAALPGATSAAYTTGSLATSDSGASFSVTVRNSAGSVSSRAARLTVSASAPSITSQPADQTVTAGQPASFSVSATGTAPLSYQWRRNGTAIAGATGATYTIAAAQTSDSGATFSVAVSNSAGSVTSRTATLTVTGGAPAITVQPADQTVHAGQTASFSVAASGSAPLSYQWRRNGAAIAGASGSSYTTAITTAADSGAQFSVLVSNAFGSITSRSALLTVTSAITQGSDVVTYKYDLARSGANLAEKTLTTANVHSATFGKLHFLGTDGKVDAQPLYLSALNVNGVARNVVFVATENDSVYAFDADSGAQLWKVSLVPAGETVNDQPQQSCDQIQPTIGITSTPVIDRSAGAHGTMYVVAMSKSTASAAWHQRLHALDVATGAELLGGPREITASYPSANGTITFDPQQYEDRAALLLVNHTIYTSWSSHCDNKFYTGWIIAYSQSTLQQTAVLNVAPNSGGVGPAIWMAGGGPAADSAGNIYLLTANGAFEEALDASGFPNQRDFANSFLKLSTGGGSLAVADYFTISNTSLESGADLDLGSGGAMLLPDMTDSGGTVRHLVLGAGKDGNVYLVNRDSMGHFSPSANNIWQQLTQVLGGRLTGNQNGGLWSTPAYFNGHVYFGPVARPLASFSINNARLAGSASSSSTPVFPYPGTSPVVSANGSANGIVWAHQNTNPAVLYAFDAANVGRELYDSSQAAGGRDQFGAGNKFITPVVIDGKVFVGTTNGVAVFGLLN
ncbi:MAG: immunoglobulin domain-containing protein [Proteobacteria bacterium]|nr:immunoglobulin domain-containing protein [Pseudomonadota bacterium]